ncbi:MAG: hypothetical protein JW779_11915 [Candidatus Thorarchaeota archaeon]|nr:hypothetical protein [Candidatus Thorarchaeota archaeon]
MTDHHDLIVPEILDLSPRQVVLEQALTEFLVSLKSKIPSKIPKKRRNKKDFQFFHVLEDILDEAEKQQVKNEEHEETIRLALKKLITSSNNAFGISDAKLDLFVNWIIDKLLVRSGKRDSKEYVSFRPYHLKAAKVYPKGWHIVGPFLYSMIASNSSVVDELSSYFEESNNLGAEYKVLCNLIDAIKYESTPKSDKKSHPLCKSAANELCMDIMRILAYGNEIPRRVMTRLIQNCLLLHISLYFLRIVKLVNAASSQSLKGSVQLPCSTCQSTEQCPYSPNIFISVEKTNKDIAKRSRIRLHEHRDEINLFVKNLIRIRKLYDFCLKKSICKQGSFDLKVVLESQRNKMSKTHFKALIKSYITSGKITFSKEQQRDLLKSSSHPLENYVEALNNHHFRNGTRRHREWYEQVASNGNQGFVRVGARGQQRGYHSNADLLKLLVLLISTEEIESEGQNPSFRTQRYMTLEEFCNIAAKKYGILFHKWNLSADMTFSDLSFIDENMEDLKNALTKLGMFRRQSDATTLQFIQPRYQVGD